MFATGGVFVSIGFGFFVANAVLALSIADYVGSDSKPMSGTTKALLRFLGFLVVFAFAYSILLVGRPLVGLGLLVTLGLLLGVYYAFRKRPIECDPSGSKNEPAEPKSSDPRSG